MSTAGPADRLTAAERGELAPTGRLRVAIAVGEAASALWATRDGGSGEPRGVTVDLGRAMAERWGLAHDLVSYPSSGAIIADAALGRWDAAFTPVDAERRRAVDFGPAYFEGVSTYMVRAGSGIRGMEDVDRPGVRVLGVENTATLRSARRSLKRTVAEGVEALDEALDRFRRGEADALALGRESLLSLLPSCPGALILAGHFHAAATAVAVPKGHAAALARAGAFIADVKRDGTLRRIFDRHGLENAAIPADDAPA